MPHSCGLQKEIFFYVNVAVFKNPCDRKSKWKIVALSYVHSIHEHYVKLHEQHYLTYIQMIDFQMSQNIMQITCPVPVHKPVQYDIHTQFVMWRYLLYS